MNIEIHYRDMKSTDGLKTHIEQRAKRLERFVKDDELIKVIVIAKGHLHAAEVFWHDKKEGKDFFAKEEGENAYTQIDQAFEKVFHQLQKAHEKMVDRHQKREPIKKILSD